MAGARTLAGPDYRVNWSVCVGRRSRGPTFVYVLSLASYMTGVCSGRRAHTGGARLSGQLERVCVQAFARSNIRLPAVSG